MSLVLPREEEVEKMFSRILHPGMHVNVSVRHFITICVMIIVL